MTESRVAKSQPHRKRRLGTGRSSTSSLFLGRAAGLTAGLCTDLRVQPQSPFRLRRMV